MKNITSRQNPEIIALAQLKNLKERYAQGRMLAEGFRVCKTLIDSQQKLIQLYVIEKSLEQAQMIAKPSLITVISEPVLEKICQTKTPSGIIGLFQLPKQPKSSALDSGIVLDGISDPGNMGTLIRSCAAMGKRTIILIGGSDPWNIKVVQASAGTIGSVNIYQWDWQQLLENKKSLALVGLVPHTGEHIENVPLSQSLLVIGSEAHGIPQNHKKSCAKLVNLTMPGNIESLNAAIAGSIAMYIAWSHKS